MPVRDAGPYLEDCLRSILDQTYQDFDFVIRDDGSVDGSTEILRHWAARDPRIRLFIGERSLGPAESANWVMRRTEATYVARMDADDIAHPDRLRRQLAVFDSCPDACLVGTLCEGIDANGRRVRPRDRWRLTRPGPFAPFPHGSIMVRRDAFERAGGYRSECNFWEDADLYFRLAGQGRLLILPNSLYLHRASGLSTRLVSPPGEVERAVDNFYRTMAGQGGAGAVARRRNCKALALGIRFAGLAAALGGQIPGHAWPDMAAQRAQLGYREPVNSGLGAVELGQPAQPSLGAERTDQGPRLHRPSPFHRRPGPRLATDAGTGA